MGVPPTPQVIVPAALQEATCPPACDHKHNRALPCYNKGDTVPIHHDGCKENSFMNCSCWKRGPRP